MSNSLYNHSVLYIPNALDIKSLVENSTVLPQDAQAFLLTQRKATGGYANLVKAYVVVAMVLVGEVINAHKVKLSAPLKTSWVPISTERLAKATGLKKPALKRLIIKPLEDLQVIKVKRLKRWGTPGGKKNLCYEYALCAPYSLGSGAKAVPLAMPYALTASQWESVSKQARGKVEAKTELDKGILANLEKLRMGGGFEAVLENGAFDTEQKRELAKMYIRAINAETKTAPNGDALSGWFFSRANNVGRLFSPVTQLKKVLRPFLRYEGQPLCEIDQSASQPFLLLAFYRHMAGDRQTIEAEAKAYANLWQGDFYQNFATLSGTGLNREDMKKAFVRGLNALSWDFAPKELRKQVVRIIYETLANRFPLLYGEIQRLKTVRDTGIVKTLERGILGKEKVYSQFGIRLQQIESEVFIDGIAGELVKRGIFFYTIHDCVACLEKDAAAVIDCMSRHLKAKTGFEPVFKGAPALNPTPRPVRGVGVHMAMAA